MMTTRKSKDSLLPNKDECRKEFLSLVQQALTDNGHMASAFNSRQSLKKDGVTYSQFDEKEIVEALRKMESGDPSPPSYTLSDPTRLGALLSASGFEKSDIDNMSISDKLKYEAAIFDAATSVRNKLDEQFMAKNLQSPVSSDQLIAWNKALEELMVDLKPLSKPVIERYQQYQQYQQARLELSQVIDRNKSDAIKENGNIIIKESDKLLNSSAPLPSLTRMLQQAKNTIESPTRENKTALIEQGKSLAKRSTSNTIKGGLLKIGAAITSLVSAITSSQTIKNKSQSLQNKSALFMNKSQIEIKKSIDKLSSETSEESHHRNTPNKLGR